MRAAPVPNNPLAENWIFWEGSALRLDRSRVSPLEPLVARGDTCWFTVPDRSNTDECYWIAWNAISPYIMELDNSVRSI